MIKNRSCIIVLLLILILGAFSGCIKTEEQGDLDNKITGSGIITTINKDFIDFTAIHLGSVFDATIIKADNYSVVFRIDDNIEEYLIVEKIDGKLKINLQPDKTYNKITNEVTITLPDIEALIVDGVSIANLSGFNFSHDLELDINGVSMLNANIDTGHIDLNVDGTSTILLSGNGTTADISVNSTSTADLSDFKTKNTTVNINGTSTVTLNINGTLNGSVKGVSTLYYLGNPILENINSDELSSIEKIE
jgi:hypothetical protein